MTISTLSEKCGNPLTERDAAGIYVALFFDRNDSECFVYYSDRNEGVSFSLNPPKFLAADCYRHPIVYADAAMRGISNPHKLVPVEMLAGSL